MVDTQLSTNTAAKKPRLLIPDRLIALASKLTSGNATSWQTMRFYQSCNQFKLELAALVAKMEGGSSQDREIVDFFNKYKAISLSVDEKKCVFELNACEAKEWIGNWEIVSKKAVEIIQKDFGFGGC